MPETLLHEPTHEISHSDAPPTLERVLAMRRDELKPNVRTYADNLHAQILRIFAEHGAKNFADFERIAREKELPMSLLEEVRDRVDHLLKIIETNGQWVDDEKFLHLPVDVNYDVDFQWLIDAGHYSSVDVGLQHDIFHGDTEGKFKFPVDREKRGREPVEIILVQLPNDRKTLSVNEILAELDQRGLRPATLWELLSLGHQYPDLPDGTAIIELGTIGKDSDQLPRIVSLTYYGGINGRRLSSPFGSKNSGYAPDHCFAAVRKEPSIIQVL